MREEDFDLLERYFSGDLDAVERGEFEEQLARDPALNARFVETYDARTETLGFRSLVAPSIELAECFSARTLERYVKDELPASARAMVIAHDRCPWCAQQIQALEALVRAPVLRGPRRWFADRKIWATAMAVAASLLFVLWLRPAPAPFRADPSLGVSATILAPRVRAVTGPSLIERSIDEERMRLRIAAVEDCFIGVWVGRESLQPAATTGIPPNLVELRKGATMEVDIPDRGGGDIELTIVVSSLAQNIAIIEGAWPSIFRPGDEFLAIDGHPRMFRLQVSR